MKRATKHIALAALLASALGACVTRPYPPEGRRLYKRVYGELAPRGSASYDVFAVTRCPDPGVAIETLTETRSPPGRRDKMEVSISIVDFDQGPMPPPPPGYPPGPRPCQGPEVRRLLRRLVIQTGPNRVKNYTLFFDDRLEVLPTGGTSRIP